MTSPIIIEEYDPQWSQRFEAVRSRIAPRPGRVRSRDRTRRKHRGSRTRRQADHRHRRSLEIGQRPSTGHRQIEGSRL